MHAFPIISANKLNHLFTNAVVAGVLGGVDAPCWAPQGKC